MTIPRSILVDYLIGYNQRLQIFFRHFTPLVLLYVGVQALVLVHVFQIIRAYWDFYNKMGHKQIFGLILMAKNVTLQLLAIGSLACSWYYLIYAEQKKPENVVIAVSFQALLFGLWVQAFRMYGAFLVALLAIECIIIKGW